MESLLKTDSTTVIQFVTDGKDTLACVAGSYEGEKFMYIYTEAGWKALRDSSDVQLAESEPVAYKDRQVSILALPTEF
jgi:hypothetical protein